jgi:hypothetical protein
MTLISVMVTVPSGAISAAGPLIIFCPKGLVRGDAGLPGGHGFPEVPHVT